MCCVLLFSLWVITMFKRLLHCLIALIVDIYVGLVTVVRFGLFWADCLRLFLRDVWALCSRVWIFGRFVYLLDFVWV